MCIRDRFGTRGDFIGSDQSNLDRSKIMQKFLKNIFISEFPNLLLLIEGKYDETTNTIKRKNEETIEKVDKEKIKVIKSN